MGQTEKAYWNHEVAADLEIGESTLRKWCIELEENGYVFIKGAHDSRAFTDFDVAALNHFKVLTKKKKHTKEQAAKMVVEKYSRKEENEGTPLVPIENGGFTKSLELLLTEISQRNIEQQEINKTLLNQTIKQEEFNKVLLSKLEQQEQFIKESIEKRDKLLLESIRSLQEHAATNEKKGFFNRIRDFFRG